MTDSAGRTATFSYSSGYLTDLTLSASSTGDATSHHWHFSYNSADMLSDWWNPDNEANYAGNTAEATQITYDSSAQVTQVVDQYKEALDQSKNTLLTAEARAKAESDVAQKAEDIRRRQTDGQPFSANAQRSLQQRISNSRSLLLDEISKKVVEIARNKGATLVVDRSGPTFLGIPSVIYADAAFDVTAEALTEINKDRPVAAAPVSPAPTATPAAPAVDTPAVTVPGLTPKN